MGKTNQTTRTPPKTARKIPADRILDQIQKSKGNVSHVARSLGMSRSALHDRIKHSVTLQKAIQDERETIVDAAENSLYASVLKKEAWAVCFTLKTIGKNRGYTEQTKNINTTINLDLSKLTDEQLEQFEELTNNGIDPVAAYNASLTHQDRKRKATTADHE